MQNPSAARLVLAFFAGLAATCGVSGALLICGLPLMAVIVPGMVAGFGIALSVANRA